MLLRSRRQWRDFWKVSRTLFFEESETEVKPADSDLWARRSSISVRCAETEASSVPIPNVNGPTLGRVLEYCKYHATSKSTAGKKEGSKNEEEIKAWDNDYIKVETNILFEIMLVSPLLDADLLRKVESH